MPTFWRVITAGPSAGKTSTLRELQIRGHQVAPEAARHVIDRLVSEGWEPEEVYNHEVFQGFVINEDFRIEGNLSPYNDVFLDRSLADNIAYLRHKDMEVPDKLFRRCQDRYKKVFILDQLPFEDDYARSEDAQEARELHGEIRQAYQDLGYEPVEVPVMSVEERADFIIDELEWRI